jgi:hypothetical protein
MGTPSDSKESNAVSMARDRGEQKMCVMYFLKGNFWASRSHWRCPSAERGGSLIESLVLGVFLKVSALLFKKNLQGYLPIL